MSEKSPLERVYGKKGYLCDINCKIFLLRLHYREEDSEKYNICIQKCLRSDKDPLDPSHLNVNDEYYKSRGIGY